VIDCREKAARVEDLNIARLDQLERLRRSDFVQEHQVYGKNTGAPFHLFDHMGFPDFLNNVLGFCFFSHCCISRSFRSRRAADSP
jgi:hypothetical protein